MSGGSRRSFSIFSLVNHLVLVLMALVTIVPLYYVLIVSFASYEQVISRTIYLFPTSLDFSAYQVIFRGAGVIRAFLISTLVTITGTLYSMAMSVSAGYALSKRYLPGRNAILTGIVFTMFFSGGLIPYYVIIRGLGLINSLLVLILPLGINTFYLIILKNWFLTIPRSLEESAKMDGANDILILYKIVLPVAAPILATISLFYAVGRWNEWWHALLFITDHRKLPLQNLLREVLARVSQNIGTEMGRTIAAMRRPIYTQAVRMAIVVITCVPIIAVYPFLQKHFTKGIIIGSIKG